MAFAEDGTVIVGGSDNGLVYIFEKNTGTLRQRLRHSQTARAQTVTVRIFANFVATLHSRTHQAYEGTDHMGILAASSNNDADTTITVMAFAVKLAGDRLWVVRFGKSFNNRDGR